MRLVWRGGNPFKETVAKKDEKPPIANGTSNDVVMILDSDDEDMPSAPPAIEEEPEFDDELGDSTTSSPEIVQFLDLFFGSSGMHLAVPAIPITSYKAASQLSPEILSQKIVFAVVCEDRKTRLVSIPLLPPSPASKLRKNASDKADEGKWDETIAVLDGHHAIADGVSFTFTSQPLEKSVVVDLEKKNNAAPEWKVIIASHSREISGVLLIHSALILSTLKENKKIYSISQQSSNVPLQTLYLPSPAVSISFKPTTESLHLLLADKSGLVKVYDPLPSSSGVLDSNNNTNQGEWLLTLYPGFLSGKGDIMDASAANYGRKPVIDAKWILSGKAIIVLLADGEWGIWDIEGAGPGASKHHGPGRPGGIKGGAYTPFTISGILDGAITKSSSARTSNSQQNSNTSRFAPMTPGTRRTAESSLFGNRNNQNWISRGQLVVTRLPSPSQAIQGNECVILWLHESYAVIPNIWSFWDTQLRKSEGGGSGNLFGGSTSGVTRMMKLESVNLQGERCTNVDYYPKEPSLLPSKNAVPLDVLVTGEHRFVVTSDTRGDLIHVRSEIEDNRQVAIAGGELDVSNIDQALSRMENGNSIGNGVVRRGVSFVS